MNASMVVACLDLSQPKRGAPQDLGKTSKGRLGKNAEEENAEKMRACASWLEAHGPRSQAIENRQGALESLQLFISAFFQRIAFLSALVWSHPRDAFDCNSTVVLLLLHSPEAFGKFVSVGSIWYLAQGRFFKVVKAEFGFALIGSSCASWLVCAPLSAGFCRLCFLV